MTPKIDINVAGTRSEVPVTAILDTGFDGYLCLPTALAVNLGLELVAEPSVELADGTMKKQLVFLGTATILSRTTPVMIYLTESDDALVGTSLLEDCVLTIDFPRESVRLRRKRGTRST
jgi:clan AA aspartic protease